MKYQSLITLYHIFLELKQLFAEKSIKYGILILGEDKNECIK